MSEGTTHLQPFVSSTITGITGGCTDSIREDGFVIEDILSPVHEGVDILGRGELRGALVTHAVFPKVFVSDFVKGSTIIALKNETERAGSPRARGHDRALVKCAMSNSERG
jgi:hypothetical protein